MHKQFLSSLLCAFFLMGVFAPSSRAQDPAAETFANAQEATDHVRALHFMRDFEGADLESRGLVIHFPDALELRAWRIVSMTRYGQNAPALAEAEAMIAADSTNRWALFAMAAALTWHNERYDEGIEASAKALAAAPEHPDFIWLRAETLTRRGHGDEAVALIDQHLETVDDPVELLATKGYAFFTSSRGADGDPAKMDEALATFEAARALDPDNVDAQYLTGWILQAARRRAEAYPFLKTAASLTVNARVHSNYWRAIMALQDKSPEEKQADIEAGIDALLAAREPTAYVLYEVANQYSSLKLADKQKEAEDRLLDIDPASEKAEWVLVNRIRRYEREHHDAIYEAEDPARRMVLQQMLTDFIDYPHHQMTGILGESYRRLFFLVKDDSTVSNERLREIIDGMIEHESLNPHATYPNGAIALAERKIDFREAERLARRGVEVVTEKLAKDRERGAFRNDGDYERNLNWMTSMMYDALGWVFLLEGRLDEAESELLRAYDTYHESPQNLYHLGQLYETRYDLAKTAASPQATGEASGQLPEVENNLMKAESYYLKGIAVQTPGENPNDDALKTLYKKQFGSLDGYETYLATAEERDRARRKKEILEARLDPSEPLEPFVLKTLDGDSLSTDELRGKTVAINTWGLWCGWCLEEMPDLQKLHDQYADSTNVLLLTINNAPNVDDVRVWMKEQGYTFPVLLDDGYLNRVQAYTFPTTWFLDQEVHKAFEKKGWSEKLVEEFTWRLEALRTE